MPRPRRLIYHNQATTGANAVRWSLAVRASLTGSTSLPRHTDTVPAVFTCTHCNAVPEQVVDGKATIAGRASHTWLPDVVGPDPHTLARPLSP